jgi:beta-glucosidase
MSWPRLHARRIAPMLTLFHWDLPQRLQDDGGWESRNCAKWFADYAAIVFRALGDGVPVWYRDVIARNGT